MTTNQLKSVFLVVFLMGNLIAFIHSTIAIFTNGAFAWWLVAGGSLAVLITFLYYIGAGKNARTSPHLPWLLASTTSLSSILLFAAKVSFFPFVYLVILSTAGSWIYVFWYSILDRSDSKLHKGNKLPDLEFYDSKNSSLRTGNLNSPLILLFYRGNWCPLCTAQVDELAKHYQSLESRGYKTLLISPQSQQETQKLAHKFDVPLIFCEDRNATVARQLGIFHERALPFGMEKMTNSADSVYPTVVITDKEHNIIWLHETDNYRVRPEPETFLKIIDQHQ